MKLSTAQNLQIKQDIINWIDLDVYEESAETAQEAAQKVVSFIMKEADHPYNRKKLVSDQAIIADHIMGLPSYFNLEYANDEILTLAQKWGSLSENCTEKEEQKIIENYPAFIAGKLQQIANGYHIKGLEYNQNA